MRRVQLYFLALNVLAVLGLVLYLGYYGHGDRSNSVAAVVSALQPPQPAREVELAALLRTRAHFTVRRSSSRHPEAVRAPPSTPPRRSRGLARLGVSRDIVLLSGVSGDGCRVRLLSRASAASCRCTRRRSADWQQFKDRMTAPFIGDVLEGAPNGAS